MEYNMENNNEYGINDRNIIYMNRSRNSEYRANNIDFKNTNKGNSNEFKTSYGTVKNINERQPKKIIISKNGIKAIVLATVMFFSGIGIGHSLKKDRPYVKLNNSIMTTINVDIEDGDVLEDIAKRFYNQSMGISFEDYKKAISAQNNIYPNYITAGENLDIPVIVNENNPYLAEIINIKNSIKYIEENNLWVNYKVEGGETLDGLAALACSSDANYTEICEIRNQIKNENQRQNNDLYIGETIKIVNPELRKLKQQLIVAQEAFKESLSNKNSYVR